MTKATSVIGKSPNWDLINDNIENGYIVTREHPEDSDLKIYNYTQKAQFDSEWNEATLMCRGLIARNESVIARPFQKFFNLSEFTSAHSNVVKGPWEVYEKMDGSLGVLYEFAKDDWRIATRGSFDSDQARWATAFLKEWHPTLRPSHLQTLMFEIIYPDNRIVVNYGDFEGLVYLGCNSVHDGKPAEYHAEEWEGFDLIPKALSYGVLDRVPQGERTNREGYVLINDKGFRVKIKHQEYLRLHRILTNLDSVKIWEAMCAGIPIETFIEEIPDEFHGWCKDIHSDIESRFRGIETSCRHNVLKVEGMDRKSQAMEIKDKEYAKVMFAMLDNKDYESIIWKLIKPIRTQP